MAEIVNMKGEGTFLKDVVKAVKSAAKKAMKLFGKKKKKKRRRNASGKSEYTVGIPKSISRKLRRQKKY